MSDKEFLVNAIELVDIGGAANIPTVLYYPNVGPPAFGAEALGLAQKRRDLNEDFKIDLGNLKAGTSGPRRQFQTASGAKKSAAELTADFIHELLQMETVRPVQVLANVLQRAFTDKKFGLFQQVQRRRFGKTFQGRFVHAIGRQPFVTFSNYEGDQSFSQDEPFVIYSDTALPLQPLMFWNHCRKHPEEHCGHCYFFDTVESSGVFSFKAVGFPCTCLVSNDNEFGPLAEELENFTKWDPTITFHKIGALRDEERVIAVPT